RHPELLFPPYPLLHYVIGRVRASVGSGKVRPARGAPGPRTELAARPQVGPCRWGTAPAWQAPWAPWYAFARRARRDAAGRHGGRRAAGFGGAKPRLAWTDDPCTRGNGRAMHGTQFAHFSAEVLLRGVAAVLPQHLPDR